MERDWMGLRGPSKAVTRSVTRSVTRFGHIAAWESLVGAKRGFGLFFSSWPNVSQNGFVSCTDSLLQMPCGIFHVAVIMRRRSRPLGIPC